MGGARDGGHCGQGQQGDRPGQAQPWHCGAGFEFLFPQLPGHILELRSCPREGGEVDAASQAEETAVEGPGEEVGAEDWGDRRPGAGKPRGGVGPHRPRQAASLSPTEFRRVRSLLSLQQRGDMIRFAPSKTSLDAERAGVEIRTGSRDHSGHRGISQTQGGGHGGGEWVDRGHLGCNPNTAP